MSDLLFELNGEQKEAVTSTEGFVRVIAGAGSGKTRALSYRFAYLVNELGILPGNILCVTFTNKSANEMRHRIRKLTGDNDTGYINTFHGFCVSVLSEDSNAVKYPKSFLVLDNSDIDEMLKMIYEERGLTLRNMTFSNARDMIEIRKTIKDPDYYLDMITMSLDVLKEKYDSAVRTDDIIFYGYLYQSKKCFGLDYNDLIKFTLYIFSQNEDIKLKWQKRLQYIMIDEFQDIDDLQYRLMEVLCGYHGNLFIVGDPDQTIYTWRGADIKYLMDFENRFPYVKTVLMMKNYRSVPQITKVADSLIDKNKNRIKKDLVPMLPDGCRTKCRHFESSEEEAYGIVSEIKELVGKGYGYSDITILYRAHYVSRTIEEAFIKEKVPYTIYSGVQFFSRAEIKDALSYMRMCVYKDDLSFLRTVNTPKRNMGKRRMGFLKEKAAATGASLYQTLIDCAEEEIFKGTKAAEYIGLIEKYSAICSGMTVSEFFSALLNESGYEQMLRTEGAQDRLDNLAELKQSIYDFEVSCGEETTAEQYITHTALFTNGDIEPGDDKVKLMTVHTAKGLEFPCVFICGFNEGIFPSRKTRTVSQMEEERRLAFVAVTRAKERLFFTESSGKNIDGTYRYPSRFLLDIDEDLFDYVDKPSDGMIEAARQHIRTAVCDVTDAATRFSSGDRVKHMVFGKGTVTDVDTVRSAYNVKFDSLDTERSISFSAKLEKDDH